MKRDLRKLPKAELHLHLEGAMRRSTLVELCQKYRIGVPMDTANQKFDNFSAFVDVYVAACNVIRHVEDLNRLVLEVAQDAASHGAVWLEIAPSFTFYADRFGGKEATLQRLAEAAEQAETKTGVGIGFIISIERQLGIPEAENLAQVVLKSRQLTIHKRPAIIGFGLHGPEEGYPPSPFQKAFQMVCGEKGNENEASSVAVDQRTSHKIASIPHAGEIAPSPGQGAKSVQDAIELLHAKRIGHGVLAAHDEDALQSILAHDVCLDLCVTSNCLLNVVPAVAEHPLTKILARKIPCTINSDDPLLFGCNLLSEYELCRNQLKLDDDALVQCARTSFQYSCAPEEVKAKYTAKVEEWLQGTL